MPFLSLTESAIYTALRSFLLGAVTMPSMEIVRAQDNRVPQPAGTDFIIFTPLRNARLATNETTYAEIEFTGAISDNVLTVSAMTFGTGLLPNMPIQSTAISITDNTIIVSQIDGTPGDIGTYQITPGGQTITPSALFSSIRLDLVATRLTVQIDVYGPASWANAQTITTLFQSSYGFQFIQDLRADVALLYCEPARQLAFTDGEQQWEDRWMLELALQINPTVMTMQEAATAVEITLDPADLS